MNFLCSLFIVTTTLLNNFNVAIEETAESFENVYIAALFQHYFSVETSLWHEIRSGRTRPQKEFVQKIHDKHNAILTSESLASVMNDKLKLKFEKFLNLTVFKSIISGDQKMVNISSDRPLIEKQVTDFLEMLRKVCSAMEKKIFFKYCY